jgi:phosphonate transport system substrate-binding protein
MEKRRFMASAVGAVLLVHGWHGAQGSERPLNIGLTPAFLHDRHGVLAEWRAYLSRRMQRDINFVLRDSYSDTMDLLKQHRLDAAWLCDYPYVLMRPHVELLATPLNEGRPYYRSYLIVPATQTSVRSIVDLEGKVFAYADPYSNTGYLAPRHELLKLKRDPKTFFRKTFFTWSHRKAIESVATHLADGAAVDSYVWESLAKVEPKLTARTRIVGRSEEFGFPPIVVQHGLAEPVAASLRQALMDMDKNHEGRAILAKLHISGFASKGHELYASVEEMARVAGERPGKY